MSESGGLALIVTRARLCRQIFNIELIHDTRAATSVGLLGAGEGWWEGCGRNHLGDGVEAMRYLLKDIIPRVRKAARRFGVKVKNGRTHEKCEFRFGKTELGFGSTGNPAMMHTGRDVSSWETITCSKFFPFPVICNHHSVDRGRQSLR